MMLRCMFFGHKWLNLGEDIRTCERCGLTIDGEHGKPVPLSRTTLARPWDYKPKGKQSKPDTE